MKRANGTPCWVDLMTSDAEGARTFYTTLFGWDYAIQAEEYGGYTMCRLQDDNVAGIGKKAPGTETPDAWTIYLAVDDLGATVSGWQERGGSVLMEPMEVPEQGHMAIVADPTGAVVGLWQPIHHDGFDVIGPAGATCWFEVNTPRSEDVRDFFTGLFGLTAERMPSMHYYMVKDTERPRFGILQMTEEWEGLPPHWMVYFNVADIEATVEQVEAHGGKVMHGPFDTPQGPIAVCADPTGAVFSVIRTTSAE